MAILTMFRHRFYKNDGSVNAGGKVYTYLAGTSTPVDTYTDSTATVANANPIILDSKGEADIWVVGQIKVNVLESDDTQVTGWPVDNVGSGVSNNDANARWAGTAGGTANALTITPSPAISEYVAGQSFIFKAGASNNSGATTIAISGLSAIAVQSNGAACVGGEILANNWYQIVLSTTAICQISKIGEPTLAELGAGWVDGGGTADAITATYNPAIPALTDGLLCFVRATAANTTTTPTFAPNGLTARTIVMQGGVALVAGSIGGDGHELILRYDLSNTRWELLNPKPVEKAALAGSAAQSFSASNFTTAQGLSFPATQNPSADANTLDDYEENTFTPVITFATAGDLSVAYSTQVGIYTKVGRVVICNVNLITSTFTHTTASGSLQVTGFPFTSAAGVAFVGGGLSWSGITKAGYTQIVPNIGSAATLATFIASASASAVSAVDAANCPTGGTMRLNFSITYLV